MQGNSAKWSVERAWLAVERRGLLAMDQLAQTMRPRYRDAPHLLVGERGEFEALFFLRRQGYVLIERRWKAPDLNGDLDLIGWEGGVLCFIEVKTRTARDMTPAATAIDDRKRTMLRKMGRAYRRTLPRSPEPVAYRFDVVSVYLLDDVVECELVRHAISHEAEAPWNTGDRFGV